jgi:hypothetical protein
LLKVALSTINEWINHRNITVHICPLSFNLSVFWLSSRYSFWLPIWYLQTFLNNKKIIFENSITYFENVNATVVKWFKHTWWMDKLLYN